MSDIAAVGEKRVFEPFDKEAFKKEILNNIKYLFRKTPETASQQEIFQAVAYIPNEEIRSEFVEAVEENHWDEFIEFERKSRDLLNATLDMDSTVVAENIEKIHMDYTSMIQYNDENSVSSVLTIAYLSAMKYYFKPIRELPTGRGFADFVFVPKHEYANIYPALLVELKWNQSAETAIAQIKERKYPSALESYTGKILLVGINYDVKTKEHQCRIEEYQC